MVGLTKAVDAGSARATPLGAFVEHVRDCIPQDQMDTIFEKFRQAGDTLTAKPEGAGLGLPISREIVLAHGGSLTARSAPAQGSCFRMTLPLAA